MSDRPATLESSLLLTLEEISQLVSHSHDLRETLSNIVGLIQSRFRTDVCSVYVLEPDRGELVLGATIGLRAESVGRVRMRTDEGLTGLVAERVGPVMVDDAFAHPRFKYFPEACEDPYHSFLGVPLVEGGSVQGVLVVQTIEPRRFTSSETRMLVTVASQLAPLISEARLLDCVGAAAHRTVPLPSPPASPPAALRGVSLSPGIGVGEAYITDDFEQRGYADRLAGDPDAEAERLAAASEAARQEITHISQRISSLVGEEHGAILQAQLMILQDRTIDQDVRRGLAAGRSAEAALVETLDQYVAAFEKLTDPFFRERVFDIKDVFRRILWHLRPGDSTRQAPDTVQRIVLIAEDVSVMDLFSVDPDRLAGVVAEHGGPQSHAAILARSLGVPMVGRVPSLRERVHPGSRVLVDGTAGLAYIDPAAGLIAQLDSPAPGVAVPSGLSAAVGRPVAGPRVEVNINLLSEVPRALACGIAGVGLYRSEFLFLARRTLPTEEEQVGTYRKLLTMLGGFPASIRTFDLRPDKIAHCAHLGSTACGSLDWRLVLESPVIQHLFRDQIRAILRAGTAGPARILVPLVVRTEQLQFVLETIERAQEQLTAEGLEFAPGLPVGIMIEVAAAAEMAEAWAGQVDYFAIGTNDLVASSLGIDRDDPVAASLNDPLHPGVLRAIDGVVTAARAAGKPVTVCGEMASDAQGAMALAALGVAALSVPVHELDRVHGVLATLPSDLLAEFRPMLSGLRTAGEARAILERATRATAGETNPALRAVPLGALPAVTITS